jgi:hypothetical protein
MKHLVLCAMVALSLLVTPADACLARHKACGIATKRVAAQRLTPVRKASKAVRTALCHRCR